MVKFALALLVLDLRNELNARTQMTGDRNYYEEVLRECGVEEHEMGQHWLTRQGRLWGMGESDELGRWQGCWGLGGR